MNSEFQRLIQQATRLTRRGELQAATETIRRALCQTEVRADDAVLDVEAREVGDAAAPVFRVAIRSHRMRAGRRLEPRLPGRGGPSRTRKGRTRAQRCCASSLNTAARADRRSAAIAGSVCLDPARITRPCPVVAAPGSLFQGPGGPMRLPAYLETSLHAGFGGENALSAGTTALTL